MGQVLLGAGDARAQVGAAPDGAGRVGLSLPPTRVESVGGGPHRGGRGRGQGGVGDGGSGGGAWDWAWDVGGRAGFPHLDGGLLARRTLLLQAQDLHKHSGGAERQDEEFDCTYLYSKKLGLALTRPNCFANAVDQEMQKLQWE